MKALAGAILAVCQVAAPAHATETPLALFVAGQFTQAEATGLAENSAQGFAIAARAALADEVMRDPPCLECLKRTEEISRRAIAADPQQPEARIYLAVAMGYEAHIIGDFAAQSRGYASEAKRQLDAALASDPNDPWALAALGSWHIEIAHSAGAVLARWLFGARFATGREYYAKAFAIAPNNLVLHFQYALAISAYDLADYRDDVETQLARAAAASPDTAYEAFVRDRAQKLLDTLRDGNLAEVHHLVRHDQGYPDAA